MNDASEREVDEPLLDAEAIIAALRSHPLAEEPLRIIRAAQHHFEEIRGRLIDILREVTVAMREEGDIEGGAHFYAIYLLAQFRAKEALPAYIDTLSLPDDGAADLWGDGITEDVARILAVLADDRLDVLDAAIRNPELAFFVRWEFAQTYLQLVLDEKLSREAAAAKLAEHLRWAIENEDAEAVDFLICELASLAVPDTLPLIDTAYERGLFAEEWAAIEEVREDFADPDASFASAIKRLAPSVYDAEVEICRWPDPTFSSPAEDGFDDDFDDDDGEYTGGISLDDQAFRDAYYDMSDELSGSGPAEDDDYRLDKGSTTIRNVEPRVGPNQPCPCGSGKKYKKCCGKPGG